MANADPIESPADGSGAALDALRVEIDEIDAAMHALLIDRSEIIDRLIAIKARQGGGSAFRPGREADMMRRLAERHRGRLPLDTVESIWRVIISTFTFLQARYAVHADFAAGDAAMRDSARFHFGFTVPLVTHFGAEGVVAAVAAAPGDLGLVPVAGQAERGAWWRALEPPDAPKIIARLPFVNRPDHPAGLPVFVLARPMAAAVVRDVSLSAIRLASWRDQVPAVLSSLGCALLDRVVDGTGGASALLACAADRAADAAAALGEFGVLSVAEVGTHAARNEPA